MSGQGIGDLGHEIGLAELAGADVDRHIQLGHARLIRPAAQLGAGLVEHPEADRHDQAGIFG
jgi:hypothetical protein